MLLIIGNGESRTDINIDTFDCIKIGCNAIYRDYRVDHLVCVDRRMVQEVVSANYNEASLIYTRPDWQSYFNNIKHIRTVPNLPYTGNDRWDEPFQWGSGPYAVLLGAKLANNSTVRLIGFDLFGNKLGKTNNVYKDTKNYNTSDKRAVDPRYWIHQIGMVFKCFPKINFVIHNDNFDLPKAWIHPNVKVDTISNIYYNT